MRAFVQMCKYVRVCACVRVCVRACVRSSHVQLAAVSQVVGQVVVDVCAEASAVLGVHAQHLPQRLHADVLQVAVGQRLHVRVGLDDLLAAREVGPDQISFTCRAGRGVQH